MSPLRTDLGPVKGGYRPQNPREAWERMLRGNDRFVNGERRHPNQDVERRAQLANGQDPFAVLFGCSDSRVAAEMVYDQGLGDLFVVRTAGHVLDPSVIGSIEFGVEILATPLVVVMGHDSCGAVKAAIGGAANGNLPKGYIRDVAEKVMPSVIQAQTAGTVEPDEVGAWHVRRTVEMLADRSTILERAVDRGETAIVGVTYRLVDGQIHLVNHLGDIGPATTLV
ncbi:carbonic anhydrase [Arsenicicoccus piscis]|uniref:carbonic anhydrase n=1 Tax=Arsenicicoccus piscis TaxID=673954 RepID=A0ABQ6HIP3_9MICO|nr:carbonic anhydrase [Arsenicicoccus piscis]GMA18355.1 carbonic anhydrase [Arsenicicoccus piscis]